MKSFLKLVEIQTKVASVLPFLYGIIFAQWMFQAFDILRTLVFLGALLCIDMATTALNNYMDYKRDKLKRGYNFEEHNAIVRDQIPIERVKWILGGLLVVGSGLGILLVGLTDYWILIIGIASFAVGILYSYGPLPISHTPLGEIFSGVMMGFFIFFVSVYIQIDSPQLLFATFSKGILSIGVNVSIIGQLIFWSVPFVLGIAGIMLGNNIADHEDDAINLRRTLPQVIGVKNSLVVLYGFYGLALIQLLVLLFLRALPLYGAFLLLVFIPVFSKLKSFGANPSKALTFGKVVESYMMLALGHIVILLMTVILNGGR